MAGANAACGIGSSVKFRKVSILVLPDPVSTFFHLFNFFSIHSLCITSGQVAQSVFGVQSESLLCFGRIYAMIFSIRRLRRASGRVLYVVLAGGLPTFAQSASEPPAQAALGAKIQMLSESLEKTRVRSCSLVIPLASRLWVIWKKRLSVCAGRSDDLRSESRNVDELNVGCRI